MTIEEQSELYNLTVAEQDLIAIIEDGLWTAKCRREAAKKFKEAMAGRKWRA